MSIRFRCQCGQKLRVGDEKAGQRARCPRCHTAVTVPAASELGDESRSTPPEPRVEPPAVPGRTASNAAAVKETSEATPMASPSAKNAAPAFDGLPISANESDPPVTVAPVIRVDDRPAAELPEIVIRDDSQDWLDDSISTKHSFESVIDYDKVAVPRRVLYLQGILLAVVALLSFVLGMLVGSRSPSGTVTAANQPCTVQGQVVYGSDTPRPDAGSAVIVLPVDRKPPAEGRVAVEGLRPGDPIPADDHISVRTLRSLGGDYARTNEQGEYRIRLPEGGRYHVLVISHRAGRSSADPLNMTDVALMGSYFAGATELLGDRKYQFKTLMMRGDATIDAAF